MTGHARFRELTFLLHRVKRNLMGPRKGTLMSTAIQRPAAKWLIDSVSAWAWFVSQCLAPASNRTTPYTDLLNPPNFKSSCSLNARLLVNCLKLSEIQVSILHNTWLFQIRPIWGNDITLIRWKSSAFHKVIGDIYSASGLRKGDKHGHGTPFYLWPILR